MRSIRFLMIGLVVALLFTPGFFGATRLAHAADTIKITTYQVLGSKDGKAHLPKKLEPYRKNLTLTGLKSFAIAKTSTLTLTKGKAVSLALTKGLGSAKLTLKDDGKILLVVKHGKKESRLVVPVGFVFASEKIKTKDGKQFFLILEKPKK